MTYLAIDPVRHRASAWDWMPLRRVARIRREANADSSSRLLALSSDRGVEYRPGDGGRQLPSDETVAAYWRVQPGDLVVNPMWAIGGGVAVSELSGAVSTAYRVYAPGPSIWPRFLHHWLRSEAAIAQYHLLVRGVTTFDRSITREDLDGIPIPVPPLAIQRAIAALLDRETLRTSALAATKRRLVELVDEHLAAVVSEATLARLAVAPDAAALPNGWRLVALRRLLLASDYGIGDPSHPEGRYAVLGMTNINGGEVLGQPGGFVSSVDERLLIAPGDLLFNRTNSRELVGKVGLVRSVERPTTFASYLVRMRTNADLATPEFLNYLLNTREVLGVARSMALPSIGQANLNPSRYAGLVLPLPPIDEQEHLVARLDELSVRAKALKKTIARQLVLLADRGRTLATSIFTGEVEVSAQA